MAEVTVLIPARNAAATLAETMETLAAQSYRDFRVLIVNDDSSDNTADIALSFLPRMQVDVLTLTVNAGVAGALNQGLAQIQTKYIARIDADDLALPTRLEKQFRFLEAHPDVAVCSTWMELFYDNGQAPHILAKPLEHDAIKTALVQYCSMSHGASMFRKSFFDDIGVFDTRLDFAEDYDLWTRGALLGKRYANLPEALTRYRQHGGQVGQQKRQLQYERDLMIKRKYMSALMDGADTGHLAEFFSMVTSFTTQEVAIGVVERSLPLLLKLGPKLPDQALFAQIAAGCIGRHLRG